METMLVSYTSTPWTKHSVAAFWEAIATFRETLTKGILDHLITPELAKYLSEEGQHGSQRRPRLEGVCLGFRRQMRGHLLTTASLSSGNPRICSCCRAGPLGCRW